MSDLMNQVTELKAKLTETLEATHSAQRSNDEIKAQFDKLGEHESVKAAADAAGKAMQEAQELKAKIEAVEKTAEYIEKAMSRLPGTQDTERKELESKSHNEMIAYLRDKTPMSEDVVKATAEAISNQSLFGVSDSKREGETKTLIAGSNPDGGYFIRPERSAKMIQRIFETSPVRSVADIQTTNSDSIEFIIDDDEAASGGWVGEVESRNETGTPKVGKLTIVAHEQYAQPKATQKMLDDAGFDVESWLAGKVTRKMTRTENTAFVVGDGSQKPRGFLSLPAWAVNGTYERGALEQINSGSLGNFTADGIKELQNSLIEEYQAGAVFGIKRASWSQIIKLKDGVGNYLLDPRSMKIGDTLTLLGKQVIFMEDMPAIANNALAMVYGNFSVGYTIVDRIGFRVLRDAFTAKPYVLFYTTKRTGGDVTNYEALKIQKLAA